MSEGEAGQAAGGEAGTPSIDSDIPRSSAPMAARAVARGARAREAAAARAAGSTGTVRSPRPEEERRVTVRRSAGVAFIAAGG